LLSIAPHSPRFSLSAYSRKKYEYRLNDSMRQKVEQAHSAIMLMNLNMRMKGKVSKDIRYADREPLFPWRPKRWDATPQIILIVGGIQCFLALSAFQAPNMSKLIGSMLVGVAGNVLKQNAIFPPPKDPEMATEEEEGRAGRNFLRGGLLGILATFLGMVVFTAPETICQICKVPLPGILATQPGLLISFKVAGCALTNFLMTSFYY
jgi:hypothetical protein